MRSRRIATPSRTALDAAANLEGVVGALHEAGLGEHLALDLGEVRGLDYYTGLVFRIVAPGLGFEVGSGGRYDSLLGRFGRPLPAVGFMLGLDRLDLLLQRQGVALPAAAEAGAGGGREHLRAAPCARPAACAADGAARPFRRRGRVSLTVALSKGKLLAGSAALFARAGLPFPEDEGRRLVVEMNGLRFLFVKDMDVPTYVEYGVADCGVAGRDVLLETGGDVLRAPRPRLRPLPPGGGAAARGRGPPRPTVDRAGGHEVPAGGGAPLPGARLLGRGGEASGSVEIAPGLGLADCIVDVVETGGTLAANGLVPVEEVASSSARFIVNRAGYHARRDEVARLLQSLREAAA